MMKWLLTALGAVLIVSGSYLASRIQTADGVSVQDIRFAGTGGLQMSALLYIPASATPGYFSAKRTALLARTVNFPAGRKAFSKN